MGRTLNDTELFELSQEVERRVAALREQGVVFQGVEYNYLTAMLEQLLGPAAIDAAREKHLLWLRANLDETEPKLREARARMRLGLNPDGSPQPNGKG